MPNIFKTTFYRSILLYPGLLISKIILILNRKLSNFDRWLTSYSYNPNAHNHEHLGPNKNAPNNKTYETSLLWALRDPYIRNIAVTGPYGSGKSSVIATFLNKNKQFHYINVSLATFDETKTKNEDWRNNVEFSIIQQLIYHVKNNTLPESRFQKIRHASLLKGGLGRIILAIYAIAVLLVLKEQYFVSIPFWKKLTPDTIIAIKYIALGITLIGTTFLLYRAFQSITSLKLSKVGLTSGSIELENKQEQSVFNKHLDEIIYFFEVTRYNVIVIEDLDRFGDTEIFTKLREVNNLINNSLQINLSVKFIYAVKDDMFKDRDRAKFFDFIIPVIPVLSTANAGDKLAKMLPSIVGEKENSKLLSAISLYIQDMRLLINIINEFHIYNSQIGDKLESNKLLAVIVYKNLYPNDFARLHNGEGDIVAAFNQKKLFVEDQYKSYNIEIARLQENIENFRRELFKSEKELRAVYVHALLSKLPNFSTILIDSIFQTPQNLQTEEAFKHLTDNRNIQYRTFEDGAGRNRELKIKFTAIEEEVDPDSSYQTRLKKLRHLTELDTNEVRSQIERLRYKALRVRSYSLKDVLNNCKDFIFPELVEKKPILKFLISEGYIDEMYHSYISFFIEGSLLQTDMDFVLSVSQRKPLPNEHLVKNCGTIASQWLSVTNYGHPAILNTKFIDWLIQETGYVSERDELALQLANGSETSLQFIRLYFQEGKAPGAMATLISGKWKGLWDLFYIDDSLTNETKDHYFMLLLTNLSPEQMVEQNTMGYVQVYIESHPDAMKLLGPDEHNNNSRALISMLEIKIHNLVYRKQFESFYNFVLNGCHYKINSRNVNSILSVLNHEPKLFSEEQFLFGNYTLIRKYTSPHVQEHIENNLKEYLDEVFFTLPSHSLEEEETILYLLNHNDLDRKRKKEIYTSFNHFYSDLRMISDKKIRRWIVADKKIRMSWLNLLECFRDSESFNAHCIAWINEAEDFGALAKVDWSEFADANEDESKAFERAIYEAGGLGLNRFNTLVDLFYHGHEELDIKNLADPWVSKLITTGSVGFTTTFLHILIARSTELACLSIARNLIEYFEESVSLNDDIYITLLDQGQDKSVRDRFYLFFNENPEQITPKIAVSIIHFLNNMDSEAAPPNLELVIELLKHQEIDRIKLLIAYHENFEDSQLLEQITLLGEPYDQITDNTKRQIIIPLNDQMKALIVMLKRRLPDYISSFSEDEDKEQIKIFFKQKHTQ